MTTLLLFELTVAGYQRMTVKKEYGSQGRPDVYTWWPHSGRLTLEGRSQTIGWDPKTEVGDSLPSAEIEKKKVSYWTGLVADRPKASTPGEEDKKYLGQEGPKFFKPVLKKR